MPPLAIVPQVGEQFARAALFNFPPSWGRIGLMIYNLKINAYNIGMRFSDYYWNDLPRKVPRRVSVCFSLLLGSLLLCVMRAV